MTLWEINIHPAEGQPDFRGQQIAKEARMLGLDSASKVLTAHGYLIEGRLTREQIDLSSRRLLFDPISEQAIVDQAGSARLQVPLRADASGAKYTIVHVFRKPGVMDPTANSARQALRDIGVQAEAVRTIRKYWIEGASATEVDRLSQKVLANTSIEQIVLGPIRIKELHLGSKYEFRRLEIPLRSLDDRQLEILSREGQLYLSLAEMKTVQAHYQKLGREPSDIELETIAQTWSEHCSHKTLTGRIEYRDENGTRLFENMLKETIFAATQKIRRQLGDEDWCISVFKDNAGVVAFDQDDHVVFKVETHNHPSAIEPYGGANTGLGGVIRDPLGTGLGAKPVCSTDVFCFASPDINPATLPPGVLHPRRVMQGVVAGVRDYGNRMGIPTVNGAVYFDDRYLGNPLVYCGNVGLLPKDKVHKEPQRGDWIVTVGGRTGRDGIHGATFSSVELTEESESISGGAVQIGDAITEKMVLDVLLQARNAGLYHAVTDCGAGGFSSAIGEMGEKLGAEVWLEKAPLKYDGLSYTEIWISEAQERMILAVPPHHWDSFHRLCQSEGVEATIIGQFTGTGILRLTYQGEEVGTLLMSFLHEGRPPVVRQATYLPGPVKAASLPQLDRVETEVAIKKILASPNVASKHWIIRQYDHEVQGGSVIKPLVGPACDGPSDAAVVRPKLGSRRGLVIACGMNPRLGDWDPYHMATSAIDEAIRNTVAVGADPKRIAILDNFCWGNTERPEALGSLVRAALGCHDLAIEWQTPFISGKDSLNNEFTWLDAKGRKETIAIPSSLLISAIGQIEDVSRAVTMDLKAVGNRLYGLGITKEEWAGSHLAMVLGKEGGLVPTVDAAVGRRLFSALHRAIQRGLVRACHDLSEGGLAIAVSEMSFAGGMGVELDIERLCQGCFVTPTVALFAESNTRFICEVPEEHSTAFEELLRDLPCFGIGRVAEHERVVIRHRDDVFCDVPWPELKQVWQATLNMD